MSAGRRIWGEAAKSTGFLLLLYRNSDVTGEMQMRKKLNRAVVASLAVVFVSMTTAYAETGFIANGKFYGLNQVVQSQGVENDVL